MNFEKACKTAETLNPTLSNNEKLVLYSLYKQTTVGDCNTRSPSILSNPSRKEMWKAWNGLRGLEKNVAKRMYIDKVQSISKS